MTNNTTYPVKFPLITVITVVYNAVSFIEETIKNVLSLKYPKLDYIIIDGGSTDGTVDIIERYASQLKCWVSEPDRGIYDAMNKGWELADADSYILFIGAGDRLVSLPEEMQIYSPCDIVYGDVYLGADTLFMAGSGWRLRVYNSLHHQALLIHKSLHLAPPFDLHFNVYADFDFNQRLMKNGAAFRFSDTFKAVAAPGGISATMHITESLRIIRKNFGMFWSFVALGGFVAVRVLPFVHRLKPLSRPS